MITFEYIKKDESTNIYIRRADEFLIAIGFTGNSLAHATKVAEDTGNYCAH